MVVPRGEAYLTQRRFSAFKCVGPIEEFERQSHILDRRHSRDEMKGLKNNADAFASNRGKLIFTKPAKIMSSNANLARSRRLQTCHHHQQRGFAGAAWPHKRNRLSRRNRKVYASQNLNWPRAAFKRELNRF